MIGLKLLAWMCLLNVTVKKGKITELSSGLISYCFKESSIAKIIFFLVTIRKCWEFLRFFCLSILMLRKQVILAYFFQASVIGKPAVWDANSQWHKKKFWMWQLRDVPRVECASLEMCLLGDRLEKFKR